MRLDPNVIRQQIANLLIAYPELEEDDQLRADMIEGSTDAHDFLRAVESKRLDAWGNSNTLASVIEQMGIRQGRFDRREKAMRELAFKIMQAANLNKIEMAEATYSIRNGTSKVIITDEGLIPDILCRLTRSPDKTRIKEMLKDGLTVNGAELSNAEAVLSIRTK